MILVGNGFGQENETFWSEATLCFLLASQSMGRTY